MIIDKIRKREKEDANEIQNELHCDNTIIAFDLHGVLSRPDMKKMAKVIRTHPEKRKLLKALRATGFMKELVVARLAGLDATVPEKKMKDLTYLCKRKDEKRYTILNPLVAQLCDAQSPDNATFDIASKALTLKVCALN